MNLRWDPYLLLEGDEVLEFWNSCLPTGVEGKMLYIMGQGFDPRMNVGIHQLMQASYNGSCDCVTVEMLNERHQPHEEFAEAAARNLDDLEKLKSARLRVVSKSVELWREEGGNRERTGPELAGRLFPSAEISGYTDVVLDVSAFPRGVYFPLLASLLKTIDAMDSGKPNLHVFAAEDAKLDGRITELGLEEDAYFVPHFRGSVMSEAAGAVVWFPIVGEGRTVQLEVVQQLIDGLEEVCPVFPMPSRDPRRADELIRQVSDFLINQWENDPRKFVYVSERNPFQTYRHLVQSVRQYHEALSPIGGCRAVISAHSSKLLSIGALLAAYELKAEIEVGLANVDATGYRIESTNDKEQAVTPFLMSLSGIAYDA